MGWSLPPRSVFAKEVTGEATLKSDEDIFDIFDEEKKLTAQVATKTETTVEESPALIRVITRDQLRIYGYHSLADVLAHLTGFYVVDDGIIPNVGVRGINGGAFSESGNVKVMIDGHPISFRSTSGNWIGPELVPTSAIDKIEIISGPGSALYGADAFLGVINVTTIKGGKLHGADLTGAAGVGGTLPAYDLDESVGDSLGSFEYLVSGRVNHEDRRGQKLPTSSPSPEIPSYLAGKTVSSGAALSSYVGIATLAYHFGDRATISSFLRGAAIERGAEFSPWMQLSNGFDPSGRLSATKVALYQLQGSLDGEFKLADTLTLRLNSMYSNGGPTADDRVEIGSQSFYVQRRFGYNAFNADAEVVWAPMKKLSLVAGVDYLYDREELLSIADVLKADLNGQKSGQVIATQPQGNKDFMNGGAYAQLNWTAIPRYLTVTAGGRGDYHNIYGAQPSALLAVVSAPLSNFRVKLLYGGAFKAPSPLLLYGVPLLLGFLIGNPNLRPEYVNTIEGEVSYEPLRFLSLSTNASYNLVNNFSQFVQQGVYLLAENLVSLRSFSWEAKIEAFWQEWIRASVSAEFNNTQASAAAGAASVDSLGYPAEMLHVSLATVLRAAHLRASVQVTVIGPRNASVANAALAGRPYVLAPYATLDATISSMNLHLFRDFETTFSIVGHNLTGTLAAYAGDNGIDYPLPPRLLMLKVAQQF